MNQLVMGVKNEIGVFVDHIYTERKFDNRKNNLRIVTRQENNQNHKVSRNNTSGYTGVSWDDKNQKWNAYITVYNKKVNLGRYINKEDAIIARKNAEIELWGDYCYKPYSEKLNEKENINEN